MVGSSSTGFIYLDLDFYFFFILLNLFPKLSLSPPHAAPFSLQITSAAFYVTICPKQQVPYDSFQGLELKLCVHARQR